MAGGLRTSRVSSWALLPILGIGALLRLWNLPSRGLIYWDEGKFCLEGLRMLGGLQALVGMHGSLAAGKAVGTAKPTHALLVALSYAVLGVHDYSPLVMNALCSTATIGLVYALARRTLGPGVALAAAALLAFAGYDIVYARSALSESDANLPFVLAVLVLTYCWRRDERGDWSAEPGAARWRFAAAVLMGLSFTINYRASVYIAVVVLIDMAFLLRRRAPMIVPAVIWGVGLAVFPVLWEGIGLATQARGYVLFRSEVTYRPSSYLAEAFYQLHQGRQSVLHFSPGLYLQWYVERQSWPATLLVLGGLVLGLVKRHIGLLLPTSLVLVPYGIYIFAPFVVPRNLDTAIPFASILGAAALVWLGERVAMSSRARPAAYVGLTALVVIAGSFYAWHLTAVRSGFSRATTYLVGKHVEPVLVTNEVMMFYLRDSVSTCDAAPLPRRPNGLASVVTHPLTYAEIDVYDNLTEQYLHAHSRRVMRYLVMGTDALGENLAASENGLPPGAHTDEHVDIYTISRQQTSRPRAGPVCSLERLA